MADQVKDALNQLDLGPVIKDLENQNKGQTQDQQTTSPPDTGGQDIDLGSFTNPKDLLKSYKEIQGAFSRMTEERKTLTQENEGLKQKLAEIEERENLGTSPQPAIDPNLMGYQPPQNLGSGSTEYDPYDPQSVQGMVAQTVNTMRIAEVLEEENQTNPAEFMERYAHVRMLGQQYPNLTRSPAGIKKLFQEADKKRKEGTRNQAFRALGIILGREPTEEDIQRFRNSFPGAQTDQTQGGGSATTNAGYMPDSTSTGRTGADINTEPDFDKLIEEATQKGDAETVTALTFQKALMEASKK